MNSQVPPTGWRFWSRWLIASFIGWVVGIIAAIVLSYLVVNPFYSEETNLILGLVMGAVLGLSQKIAVRRLLPLKFRWVWGSAIGLGIPLMIAVIIDEIWFASSEPSDWWLLLVVVIGAALAGVLQAQVLKPYTSRAQWWILASAISWGLAWLTSIVLGEAGLLAGGFIMGAVSGALLNWLLGFSPTDEAV